MADRGDLEPDHRDLLAVDRPLLARALGRAADPLLAGRIVDVEDLVIVGVDAFLHRAGPLPARFPHARELALEREVAQRDSGDTELAVVAARATGHAAAR